MTLKITHLFQSTKGDGPDSSLVKPSDWNHDHVVATDTATGIVLGRDTSGPGNIEELPLAYDATHFTWKFASTGGLQVPTGLTSERPSVPANGTIRWNTETNQLEIYGLSGGGWSAVALGSFVQPGFVMAFAGSSTPPGWLFCDGRSLVRTAHPGLFAAIGTAWGLGSNSPVNTTFSLPGLIDCTIVGAGDLYGLGGKRGAFAKDVPLPQHQHNLLDQHGSLVGVPIPVGVNIGMGGTGGGNALWQQFNGGDPGDPTMIQNVTGLTGVAGQQINVEQPGAGLFWYIKDG